MTTALRTRLAVSALAAASSLIAISAPVRAQSVCSLTGTDFLCTNGGAAIAVDATTANAAAAQGITVTDPDTLAATASGTITTTAALPGLSAITVGDLSLVPGGSGALNVAATGTGPGVTLTSSSGSVTATLGSLSAVNDYALYANGATGATVSTGPVTVTNLTALSVPVPILGVSVGAGAAVRAAAGNAALTVNGAVSATGSADRIVGAASLADTGTASVSVLGPVTVTNTATGSAVGAAAIGSTGASVNVTGLTSITGDDGTALAAVTTTGLASVTCGNVTAIGADVTGVFASGTNVAVTCGNVTVNGAGSIGVETVATGTTNLAVGNVSATGAGTTGIEVSGTTGPVTVTTGTLLTNGTSAPALVVNGGTGNVSLTTGTVTTTGGTVAGANASAGIAATTSSGNLTINSGSVATTGVGVFARTGTGNQNITVAGAQSGGTAIDAQALGTGAVTVTSTAPVNSTSGFGIRVQGTTGALTVNAAGASGVLGGVNVLSTGVAPVTVNATGGTTTSTGADAIRLASLGTATTTVSAGATVQGQGGFDAIDTRGTTGNTVTIGGTVNLSPSGAYAINSTGGATTVTVQSTGNLTGPVLFTGTNADTITNNGTFRFTGTSDLGAGTDTFTNNGNLSLTNSATVDGLETLTNTSGATVIANGTTTLNGTTFANAGQIIATGGTATLSGLTTFNNTGLITMVDGAANDTLTINSPYNGSGAARLAVDVDGNLNAADRLVVNGNITGSTVVDVNLVGSTPLYNPTGVAVVTAGTGFTVGANAFTLAPADAQVGFLNYNLAQVGNNTLLRSNLDPSFTDVALLGSLGQEMWYQSFDAYHDAIMGRHSGSLSSGHSIGIWGQLYESKDRYGDAGRTTVVNGTTIGYSDRLRTHRRGGQVGLEYRGPGFVIGATGGYEWARSEESPAVANLKAEGYNYGAYALFGMASGLYGGVMVKRDDYNVNFNNSVRGVAFENDAHSTGIDGEVGFKTAASGPVVFDLNAGLSWVKSNLDPWTQYGLTFDWQQNKSMRGRLGARATFPSAMGAFIGAKVFHEFKDDGYLLVGNSSNVATVNLPHRGTWGRLEGGISAGGALVTLWGDVGDTRSFGGRVGFRF